MSSSSSGSSDQAQLLVLAAIVLAVAYVGLTLIAQDVADTGFRTTREQTRSLVREYDNAKDRFGAALEHLANDGNHSASERYLVDRAFDELLANYTELEASRRTHLDAELESFTAAPSGRDVTAEVNLTFQDEFTRVNETTEFTFPLYLSDPWWDTSWDFRIPVVVDTRLLERTHYGAEVDFNLTQAVERAGSPGTTVDSASLRVVETDEDGALVDATPQVPRSVEERPGYDATDDARVRVVFNVTGETQERTTRWFYVYFDDADHAPSPPTPSPTVFNDSFERGTLGSDWDQSSSSTDTTHAHDGDHAWKTHGGQTPGHAIGSEFWGVVDVWFHDEDPADTDVDSWFRVQVNRTDTGDPLDFGLGADRDVTGDNYTIWRDQADGTDAFLDTDLTRSEGWHRFTFVLNATRMDMYIDRKRVHTNITLSLYKLEEVEMIHGGGTADVWFDEVRIHDGVTLSRVHPVDVVVRWPQRAES